MDKRICVVGSRRCTKYGEDVVRDIVGHLTGDGVEIVSGMDRGIDSLALLTAVEVGGRAVGMLGYGIGYLKRDKDTSNLARRLVEGGGRVFSMFKKAQYPTKYTFVYRNQKMVEMCDAVLVVEATLEGGSMSTAQIALELEKPVFAVPGSVFSYTSVGTNLLIQNGAHLVARVEDVFVL